MYDKTNTKDKILTEAEKATSLVIALWTLFSESGDKVLYGITNRIWDHLRMIKTLTNEECHEKQ